MTQFPQSGFRIDMAALVILNGARDMIHLEPVGSLDDVCEAEADHYRQVASVALTTYYDAYELRKAR